MMKYEQKLFEGNSDELLCERRNSTAGPIIWCKDQTFRPLFDRITTSADKSLGIGLHRVKELEL